MVELWAAVTNGEKIEEGTEIIVVVTCPHQ
jgi:hypothetical protein